jgi:hypothetical protein
MPPIIQIPIWGSAPPPEITAIEEPPEPEEPPGATIVWQPDMSSIVTARSTWEVSNMNDAPGGTVGVLWENYAMKALRIASGVHDGIGDDCTILGRTWTRAFYGPTSMVSGSIQSVAPILEAWYRYALYFDPDLIPGVNQSQGVKLPGFSCYENTNDAVWSLRLWHAPPANNQVELRGYFWDAGPAYPEDFFAFASAPKMDIGAVAWLRGYMKMNTFTGGVPNSDGIVRVWLGETIVHERTDIRLSNTNVVAPGRTGDVNHFWGNIFHGGSVGPNSVIHHEFGGIQVSFDGLPSLPGVVSKALDLNSNSWSATWNVAGTNGNQRDNMEYSNAHQDSDGRQLEFSMAQHNRIAGDNVGVRWADFTATGAPTGSYYTPNNDTEISETDNMPTLFLEWKKWCWLKGFKVIDITNSASPVFIHKNIVGPTSFDDIQAVTLGGSATTAMWSSNYNPATITNWNGGLTAAIYFGGGYFFNYRGADLPSMKYMDANPSFNSGQPISSSNKPLRLRVWTYNADAPLVARHAVKVGDWIYWGGARQQDSIGNDDFSKGNRFYRIKWSDLATQANNLSGITQQNLPDIPGSLSYQTRFSLMCADIPRKRIIYINAQGAFLYHIPDDDSINGYWLGPFTWGLPGTSWGNTLSSGQGGPTGGDWHGFIGTHRSDLNCTFFRYNLGKKWNRIQWNEERPFAIVT